MRNINTDAARKRNKELYINRIKTYNLNPKLCPECLKPIPYGKDKRIVCCSQKCAAKHGILGGKRKGNPRRYCKRCNKPLSYNTKGEYCKKCKSIVETEYRIEHHLPITEERLRRYLKNIRGHKCEECKLTTWNNKSIPLDVHHIDGNWKNNKLTNLKLLCKNCHALTDSYGSKNIGNGRPFTKKCSSFSIKASF